MRFSGIFLFLHFKATVLTVLSVSTTSIQQLKFVYNPNYFDMSKKQPTTRWKREQTIGDAN